LSPNKTASRSRSGLHLDNAQVIDMMDALKKSLRETVRTGKRPRIAGAHAAARNAERLAS